MFGILASAALMPAPVRLGAPWPVRARAPWPVRARAPLLLDASDELQEELDALRTLYRQDVESLQYTVDALTAQLEGRGDGSSRTSSDPEVSELEAELAEYKDRALRAEAELEDTRAEIVAVKQLAADDVLANEGLMRDLEEQLREAKAIGQAERDGGGAVGETNQELREQIADLLEALQEAEVASAELMALRPKYAELELKLKGGSKIGLGTAPSAGVMDMKISDEDGDSCTNELDW